jgi:hypothetical protein
MDTTKSPRPLFITMGCSFYFIYWAVSGIALVAALLVRLGQAFPSFSDIASQINLIFLGVQVNVSVVTWLIAVGLLAGIIGYWLFQKWAVIVYGAASVALFIVSLPATSSAPSKGLYVALVLYTLASLFAINIAMVALGIIYFKRMK